jgi:hypothetical protein
LQENCSKVLRLHNLHKAIEKLRRFDDVMDVEMKRRVATAQKAPLPHGQQAEVGPSVKPVDAKA